jgi:hypothetical protein
MLFKQERKTDFMGLTKVTARISPFGNGRGALQDCR